MAAAWIRAVACLLAEIWLSCHAKLFRKEKHVIASERPSRMLREIIQHSKIDMFETSRDRNIRMIAGYR
jgi:hypothetical protein